METEPGRKHAVERRRRAAALDVAEHGLPQLEARPRLDLSLEHLPDPAEPHVAERVELTGLQLHRAFLRLRTFGHDDDRRIVPREPLLDVAADRIDVERTLRDEDDVRTPGQAGVQRDPTGVPPHPLDDEHSMVRLRRGVQSVDRVDRDLHRRVEAERVVGGAEVVVDGLRYADNPKTVFGEARRDTQRGLAADRDQAVDAQRREVGLDLLDAALDLEGVGSRGAEDRATARKNAASRADVERHRVALQRPAPAVTETDELVAVDLGALAHDCADHRVETRTVAATGQHSDTHAASLYTG